MKKKLTLFYIFILSFIGFSSFAVNDNPFAELLKKLEEFTKKYLSEKVYLHLDKPYYAAGDDIWFKAYVVDSRTTAPSAISNILYVELIDQRDSVFQQLKLPMQAGMTWGDFKLSDTLTEGNYRLRAYTQWMRNAGPDFFFDKTIKIGNSWTNKVFTTSNSQITEQNNVQKITTTIAFANKSNTPYANTSVKYTIQTSKKNIIERNGKTNAQGELNVSYELSDPQFKDAKIITSILINGQEVVKVIPIRPASNILDVQFFPESGALINGLPTKIAVKSVNINGLGENMSGVIKDNDGMEVLSFETTYLGMGSFSLTPDANKKYTAVIKGKNGYQKTYNLPKIETSGYALAVNNLDSAKMGIRIMLSSDLVNKGELNLVAQHNGNVYFSTKVPTAKQLSSVIIPTGDFPSGIVQLTLFSPEQIPVCERIAFVNNLNDKINLDIPNFKQAYGKKQKVDLSLTALNSNKPVQGSFSVAVTNSTIVKPDLDNESNILTSLLLTSDLVGFVEKPNHYFLNNGLTTRIELDNLLLTQGWRKINWKEVENSTQQTTVFQAEKSLKISGIVTTNNNKPVAKGKIALLSSTKGMFVTTTETDENGKFIFDEMSFGDSLKFVVQASTKEDKKNVKVKLDIVPNQVSSVNKNNGNIEVNVNTSLTNYLKESDLFFEEQMSKGFLTRVNQLKAVTVTQKAKKKEDSASVNSTNLNGRGRANFIVTANDLIHTMDLAQYLRSGRVPGVTVSTDQAFNNIPMLTRPRTPPQKPDNPDDPEQPYMAISIDGMVVQKLSADLINVEDIESIEVITDVSLSALYGSEGYYGVLVITTKRGTGRKMSEIYAPGIAIFSPKGYDISRQFYSPKYDVAPDNKPDLRTTIYWNPLLITDATGKASFNYFNTDQAGSYRVVIEGIDGSGNLARKVYTYEVK